MTTKQRPIINNRSISVLVFSVYKACYYQKCYSNNHIRPGQGLIEKKNQITLFQSLNDGYFYQCGPSLGWFCLSTGLKPLHIPPSMDDAECE